MKIFIDLDGTLIDSRMRVYKLFCDLSGSTRMDFNAYWELKRSGIKNEKIIEDQLNFSDEEIRDFLTKWFELIESEKYLKFDRLFPFALDSLESLMSDHHEIILTTSRRQQKIARIQINDFFGPYFFSQILISGSGEKESSIRENTTGLSSSDVIVGDTEAEINAGKGLNINTISVLSGFRSEEFLRECNPDKIIQDISFLKDYLKNKN